MLSEGTRCGIFSFIYILKLITLCRLIALRKISNTLDSDRRSIRNNLHYLFFILPWPISVYLYHTSSTPSFSISCIYSFSIFCTIRLDSQLRAILWSSWLVSQYKTWCINSSPLHFPLPRVFVMFLCMYSYSIPLTIVVFGLPNSQLLLLLVLLYTSFVRSMYLLRKHEYL